MTRRKRADSPTPPSKRTTFEIPASLQQLSAISRTLAKQADTFAAFDHKQQNAHAIAQAQAFTLTQAKGQVSRSAPSSSPAQTQKLMVQGTKPSQEQIRPYSQAQISSFSNAPVTPGAKVLTSPQTFPQSNKPPFLPPSAALAQNYSEPSVAEGETLCLEKHPHQIAALIAKKRAENEANRRRERWSQAQFAHRLSQAPDDQLLSELNHELNRQSTGPPMNTPLAKDTPDKMADQDRPPATFVPEQPSQKPVNTGAQPPAPTTRHPLITRMQPSSEDHDSLFSSPAQSPAPPPKQPPSQPSLTNTQPSRVDVLPSTESFSSQPRTTAAQYLPDNSKPQYTPDNSHYQQNMQAMHYLSNNPYNSRPVSPPKSNLSPPVNNFPTVPYKIDPRLWNNPASSEQGYIQYQHTFATGPFNRGGPYSNAPKPPPAKETNFRAAAPRDNFRPYRPVDRSNEGGPSRANVGMMPPQGGRYGVQ